MKLIFFCVEIYIYLFTIADFLTFANLYYGLIE